MKRPFLSSLVTLLMCGAHSQLLSPEQIQKNLAARERSIRNLSATLETGREFEVDKSVKGKLKERKTSLPIETFFYDQGTFLSKAEYDSNINSYKFRAVEEKKFKKGLFLDYVYDKTSGFRGNGSVQFTEAPTDWQTPLTLSGWTGTKPASEVVRDYLSKDPKPLVVAHGGGQTELVFHQGADNRFTLIINENCLPVYWEWFRAEHRGVSTADFRKICRVTRSGMFRGVTLGVQGLVRDEVVIDGKVITRDSQFLSVNHVNVNGENFELPQLTCPKGTQVIDTVSGVKYTVDSSGRVLRQGAGAQLYSLVPLGVLVASLASTFCWIGARFVTLLALRSF